ncbi:MAG: hypothetical protein HY321_22375 [Armatimonadetes bacterium]|nr:hypothetical protein [Armatimonadota bacterium]
MATVMYQEAYGRARELRERLDRMRQWFDTRADAADDEELRWRRDRFEAVQREYDELLQIIRTYGKAPGANGARGSSTASDVRDELE